MRLSFQTSLLATTYFILRTNALPRPVTYSVVNVDGGSQTAATPTVIYETITKSDDTPATVAVTMTATEHTTQWAHAETTETALIPAVSEQPEGSPTHYVPIPQVTQDSTVTVVSVVTPTQAKTTQYYDNGQWHTSYAVKHWSSAVASHPGQWAPSSSGVASASGYVSSQGWNSSARY